jgi:tRNA nucleotidyltransferase/poly(A) polymerase
VNDHSHTNFEDAKHILETLNGAGYSSMFAGGCVRDRLLKLTPKDYDVATAATPDQSMTLFSEKGFRVVPTGFDHGTITVVTKSGPVEVTTLRRDVSTDGRHAIVDFTGATFETDAARRDFTINALFEDVTGQIHDFHSGLDDIKTKTLRFVGSPQQRIREDYLRILRFFRFWARLGFTPDPAALPVLSREASGLSKISQERITQELWQTLSAAHAGEPIASMNKLGVMKIILPEAAPSESLQKIIYIDAESTPTHVRPWNQLCVLLGITQGKIWTKPSLQALAKRLRFSERQSKLLADIILGWQYLTAIPRQTALALEFIDQMEHHDPTYTVLNFFTPVWMFLARHAHDTNRQEMIAFVITTETTSGDRRKSPLPVTGHDVMVAIPGIRGPEIGELVEKLRRAFYNGEWRTRHEGLDYIRQLHCE